MAKITIELNEDNELRDIELYINRHKLASALYDVSKLRRDIYKGYLPKGLIITVKDNKVLTEEDFNESRKTGKLIQGTKTYIDREYIEDILLNILEGLGDIID